MRKVLSVLVIAAVAAGFIVAGCGPQKAESSNAAIDASKAMETAQAKVDYLMGQAQAFYNSKEFQQAVDIAQYVLSNLDKESTQAKDVLQKAKAQLEALAKQKVEEMKGKIGSFGK